MKKKIINVFYLLYDFAPKKSFILFYSITLSISISTNLIFFLTNEIEFGRNSYTITTWRANI